MLVTAATAHIMVTAATAHMLTAHRRRMAGFVKVVLLTGNGASYAPHASTQSAAYLRLPTPQSELSNMHIPEQDCEEIQEHTHASEPYLSSPSITDKALKHFSVALTGLPSGLVWQQAYTQIVHGLGGMHRGLRNEHGVGARMQQGKAYTTKPAPQPLEELE
jgi:hypothetical protein